MATKRVKMLDGRKKAEESECLAVDRISKLPDSVIHHILSFLPTIDVIGMSLLSKRWRRMWYSVPTLNLSDNDIGKRDRMEYFNKFVDKCLKCREVSMRYIADSSITRFKLKMPYYGGKTRVDKWLNFVVKNGVEELELCIESMKHKIKAFYCVPETVLNAQSLTLLKLDGLKMEAPLQVSLPSLKLLFLKSIVGLNDHSFQDLMANCPALETLVLKECEGLAAPQVLSSSLKSAEVQLDSSQTIKIDATNLQSLHVQGSVIEISLATCMSLKTLSLFKAELDDLLFYLGLEGGHDLESMTLSECYGWKRFDNIRWQHLKNLVISKPVSKDVDAIRINAPNLVSFTYKTCDIKFNISLNSPNLLFCNVKLVRYSHYSHTYDMSWYVDLICLLSNLRCSKNMSLHVPSDKALIFPKNLRSICCRSLLAVEHLKVQTYHRLWDRSILKDALYWLTPSLKSLSMERQKKGLYF